MVRANELHVLVHATLQPVLGLVAPKLPPLVDRRGSTLRTERIALSNLVLEARKVLLQALHKIEKRVRPAEGHVEGLSASFGSRRRQHETVRDVLHVSKVQGLIFALYVELLT